MAAHPEDPAGTPPADESAGAVRAGRIRPGAVTAAVITAEAFLLGAVVALVESGPLRWIAGAAGLLVLVAHAVPVCGRRLYRWIPVLARFRSGRAGADQGAGELGLVSALLPAVRVTTSNVGRATTPVGVAHDGQAWVGLLAVDRDDVVGGQSPDLPLGRLAAQLDVAGGGPGSVQVLLQLIPSGGGEAASLARQAWIALRLDPLAQRSPSGRAKSVGEVQKALARAVHRAVELLESAGVRCRVLDDAGVREALRRAQAEPGEAGEPMQTRTALTGHARHTTFRLQRWPSGGFTALLAATNAIAASSVTVSVTVSAFENGEAALTAQVRTSGPADSAEAGRETVRAAAEAGVRLVSLRAEQAEGFLATLPLGRAAAAGHPGAAGLVVADKETLRLPLPAAGLVLGRKRDGQALRAQLLRPRPTHAGVFGPFQVAQVLALRMLASGVPVHVVTGRPALWAPLRAAAGTGGAQLELHPPGSGPEEAGSGKPLLVVDDTQGLAVVGMRRNISAWQAVVVVRSHVSTGDARLLRSYDAVLFQRIAGRTDPLTTILPDDAVRYAAQLAPGVVGVSSAGAVTFADLAVTPREQGLLRGGEPAAALTAAGKR